MDQSPNGQELSRGLKNRHIQLIAIGGAIGTGLFLGSGKSIHFAGPSIMLVYFVIGLALFFMMRALGELLMYKPITGSFTHFAETFIGPWAGFITGWTYWFCWIVTGIAEITAVGMYVQFWVPDLPQWIPALICVAVLFLINIATVKAFGEMEFWFAIIKVVTIIALIVIGILLVFAGFQSNGGHASFTNLWQHGGFFPNGSKGFLLKAINQIPLRILLFYVGALFVIMSIYPWNRLNPDASPFVRVFADIGLPAAAGIINFVVLTSAASSCNSGIFSTSRMLYSLAEDGKAPKIFKKLNKRNVPAPALLGSTIMLLIGVMLNYFMKSTQVFTLVTSISSICFVWVWGVIMVAHLRFRKNMPEEAAKISFKLPFAPVINWIVLLFFVFVLVVLGIAKDTRVALFVTPVWFILLVIAYGLTRKKKSI